MPGAAAADAALALADDVRLLGRPGAWLLSPIGRDG
jgi:hypothetical protein